LLKILMGQLCPVFFEKEVAMKYDNGCVLAEKFEEYFDNLFTNKPSLFPAHDAHMDNCVNCTVAYEEARDTYHKRISERKEEKYV
jgi:hypothetical protein